VHARAHSVRGREVALCQVLRRAGQVPSDPARGPVKPCQGTIGPCQGTVGLCQGGRPQPRRAPQPPRTRAAPQERAAEGGALLPLAGSFRCALYRLAA